MAAKASPGTGAADRPADGDERDQPTTARPRPVDDLDRRIIKMLQVNGRLTNTEIARALDITETTVRKRITHLLDEKLMNIVAVATPEAVGGTLSAIMGLSVELTAMHSVGDLVRTYPEVRYVGMSAGASRSSSRPSSSTKSTCSSSSPTGSARCPASPTSRRPSSQGGQILLRVGNHLIVSAAQPLAQGPECDPLLPRHPGLGPGRRDDPADRAGDT